MLLQKSSQDRRSTLPNDYLVYLDESECDIGHVIDLATIHKTIYSLLSNLWLEAIRDEMHSITLKETRELVEPPKGCKLIGCKWVYNTKKDSKGKKEWFEARLVAK